MPRAPRPLPSVLHGDVHAVSSLVEHGVSVERARRSDISRPYRGVIAHNFDLSSLRARAVALSVRQHMPPFAFSHQTGAALLGLALPASVRHDRLHVTVPHPHRAPRLEGVAGHAYRLDQTYVDVHSIVLESTGEARFVSVLSEPWLLVTLATVVGLDDIVALADAMRWRAHSEGRELDFSAALAEGRAGSARAARALSLSELGVRSRPESLLRLNLARAGLPPATVAHTITGQGWSATPDLAWPQFKVLVEYEGDGHRTSARQFSHDVQRFERYADAGWQAIRATKLDLFSEFDELVARVASRLRRNGWDARRRWRPRRTPPAHP